MVQLYKTLLCIQIVLAVRETMCTIKIKFHSLICKLTPFDDRCQLSNKSDFSSSQARYWAFLFENLRRAVDDLYRTCESDESIPAVKEVILVFENYVRDFRNLANWLKLNRDYENTPPPQRPTSLAWEVRKTPPASSGPLAKLTPTRY